jgi:hypothetical protein
MFSDEEGNLASLVAQNLGIEIEILSAASALLLGRLIVHAEPYHDPFRF